MWSTWPAELTPEQVAVILDRPSRGKGCDQFEEGRNRIERQSYSSYSGSSESESSDGEVAASVATKKTHRLDLSSDDEGQAGAAVGGKAKVLYDSEEEERKSPEQKAARRKQRRLDTAVYVAAYDLECVEDAARKVIASQLARDRAAAVSARLRENLSRPPAGAVRATGRKRILRRSDSSDSEASDAAI